MWKTIKTYIGNYADTWTREQVEAEVRNYVLRLGGGAFIGAGVSNGSWVTIAAGILPFIAAQIWFYLSKLNDHEPPAVP